MTSYCPHCEASLQAQARTCAECGREVPDSDRRTRAAHRSAAGASAEQAAGAIPGADPVPVRTAVVPAEQSGADIPTVAGGPAEPAVPEGPTVALAPMPPAMSEEPGALTAPGTRTAPEASQISGVSDAAELPGRPDDPRTPPPGPPADANATPPADPPVMTGPRPAVPPAKFPTAPGAPPPAPATPSAPPAAPRSAAGPPPPPAPATPPRQPASALPTAPGIPPAPPPVGFDPYSTQSASGVFMVEGPSGVITGGPTLPPPPPGYAPGAASPFGAFLGRTFRGDWTGAVRAALWPVGTLLVMAVVLAIPSYGQDSGEVVVGFGNRMRIALALLLQAVGGTFGVHAFDNAGIGGALSGDAGSGSLSVVPLTVTVLLLAMLRLGVRAQRARRPAPGHPSTMADLEAAVRVALSVAAAVLVLALFAQPAIAGIGISSSPVPATLGALLLSLAVCAGTPHDEEAARLLAGRPALRTLLHAAGTALRALTVVLVLCSVVAFIAIGRIDDLGELTGLDGTGVSPLLLALLILPNLAVAALGLSWGAPLRATGGGGSSFGGGYDTRSFGLAELADTSGAWAVVGAVALGVVCALTVGVLAARRSADRREQVLAAGLFLGLFLLLAAAGGVGAQARGSSNVLGATGSGSVDVSVSVPDALLFGLLWTVTAVFLAPYLTRTPGARIRFAPPVPDAPPPGAATLDPAARTADGMTGPAPAGRACAEPAAARPPAVADGTPTPAYESGVPSSGPAPAAPSTAPAGSSGHVGGPYPAAPYIPREPAPYAPARSGPYVSYHPHSSTPRQATPRQATARGRAVVWIATLAGAFLIGGGIAAGVLLWQNHGDDTEGKGSDRPGAGGSERPGERTPDESGPSTAGVGAQGGADGAGGAQGGARASGGAQGGVDGADGPADVPDGYHRVTDIQGFSFAAPEDWTRRDVKNGSQITYAGPAGPENFLVGVIPDAGYTSYDNFTHMEQVAREKKRDYHRVTMESNVFQGMPGAIWEYTYTDESGRTVHCKDQGYVAENGTEYSILLTARDDLWESDMIETYRTALDSWQLT